MLRNLYKNLVSFHKHYTNEESLTRLYSSIHKSDTIPDYVTGALKSNGPYDNHEVKRSNEIKRITCYQFGFDRSNIELSVVYTTTEKKLHLIVRIVCMFVYILNRYNRQSDVKIILAPFKTQKQLPDMKHIPLSAINVNSGFCNGSYVMIYRSEEMFKVLLHELCHLYNIDFRDESHDHAFEKKFNIKASGVNGIRLFESYNEMITTVLYIGCTVFHNNFKRSRIIDYPQFTRQYVDMLGNVTNYVINTTVRIMKHYNCKTFCGFEEQSHIYSYYVCKAAILFHFLEFYKWLGKDIVMDRKPVRIKEYVGLLELWLKDPQFQNVVNSGLRKNDRVPSTSLRMLNIDII